MRKMEIIALAATFIPLSLSAHWVNTTEGVGEKTDSAKYEIGRASCRERV